MQTKQCDQCEEQFIPREAKARFCCPTCKAEWFAEERRRALALFRQSHREGERA
jgi:uncharacterized Zn ribbon protein